MKLLFAFLFAFEAVAASVNVTWLDSESTPTNSPPAGYIVRYGPSSGNKLTSVNAGLTNLVRITGIPDNQQIYMDVVAYSSVGVQSLPSEEITFSTSVPKAPSGLKLTNNSVVVTVTIEPGK